MWVDGGHEVDDIRLGDVDGLSPIDCLPEEIGEAESCERHRMDVH
jgi:hypothetical protein